jgi:hypothetical protein
VFQVHVLYCSESVLFDDLNECGACYPEARYKEEMAKLQEKWDGGELHSHGARVGQVQVR